MSKATLVKPVISIIGTPFRVFMRFDKLGFVGKTVFVVKF